MNASFGECCCTRTFEVVDILVEDRIVNLMGIMIKAEGRREFWRPSITKT